MVTVGDAAASAKSADGVGGGGGGGGSILLDLPPHDETVRTKRRRITPGRDRASIVNPRIGDKITG